MTVLSLKIEESQQHPLRKSWPTDQTGQFSVHLSSAQPGCCKKKGRQFKWSENPESTVNTQLLTQHTQLFVLSFDTINESWCVSRSSYCPKWHSLHLKILHHQHFLSEPTASKALLEAWFMLEINCATRLCFSKLRTRSQRNSSRFMKTLWGLQKDSRDQTATKLAVVDIFFLAHAISQLGNIKGIIAGPEMVATTCFYHMPNTAVAT